MADATCMQPQWTQAKEFLEDVRNKSSQCSHSGAIRQCYFALISTIRGMCRQWADIEKGTDCLQFTALRLKTVSSINKRQDDVIDALVSFFEHALPAPGGIVNATNIAIPNVPKSTVDSVATPNMVYGNDPSPNMAYGNAPNPNMPYGNVPNPKMALGNVPTARTVPIPGMAYGIVPNPNMAYGNIPTVPNPSIAYGIVLNLNMAYGNIPTVSNPSMAYVSSPNIYGMVLNPSVANGNVPNATFLKTVIVPEAVKSTEPAKPVQMVNLRAHNLSLKRYEKIWSHNPHKEAN